MSVNLLILRTIARNLGLDLTHWRPYSFVDGSLNIKFFNYFQKLYDQELRLFLKDEWSVGSSFQEFKGHILNNRNDCEDYILEVYYAIMQIEKS